MSKRSGCVDHRLQRLVVVTKGPFLTADILTVQQSQKLVVRTNENNCPVGSTPFFFLSASTGSRFRSVLLNSNYMSCMCAVPMIIAAAATPAIVIAHRRAR